MTRTQKETLRDLLYKYWSDLDPKDEKLKKICVTLITQIEED